MRRCLRDPTFSRFDTIPECDRHTHTHTHTHTQTHTQTHRHTTTANTALSIALRGKKNDIAIEETVPTVVHVISPGKEIEFTVEKINVASRLKAGNEGVRIANMMN